MAEKKPDKKKDKKKEVKKDPIVELTVFKQTYTWITFLITDRLDVTFKWACFHVDSDPFEMKLGQVKWNPGWRKYVFYPTSETMFDGICLDDISEFLTLVNSNHKKIRDIRNGKKQKPEKEVSKKDGQKKDSKEKKAESKTN